MCRYLLLALLLAAAATAGAQDRPNVVLIFTDDQGMHDVGVYGSEIPTPNIDRLAHEGLRFDSWYVAASICTPSRYGLLTGRNPSRSHDRLLGALMFLSPDDRDRGLRPHETTLAEVLRGVGYRTALIGKWHLGHGAAHFLPTRHGFDHYYGHTGGCVDYFTMRYGIEPDWYEGESHVDAAGYATDLLTDEAVRFLSDQHPVQPFFLYLAYNAPHFGKGWDAQHEAPVNILQPHAADLVRVGHVADPVRRLYAATVVRLDDGVGRVLEALDAHGLRDNTLVLFMTDHGGDPAYGGSNRPFRGDKATLFEGGIRVPSLMRWPGVIRPGTTTSAVASALDVFPTLSRLAGVAPAPYEPDGRDLMPLLRGEPGEARELFWELGQHAELARGAWVALRSGDWKYLRTNEDEEMLFDLAKDPHEQHNLAGRHPQQLNTLRARSEALSAHYRSR